MQWDTEKEKWKKIYIFCLFFLDRPVCEYYTSKITQNGYKKDWNNLINGDTRQPEKSVLFSVVSNESNEI